MNTEVHAYLHAGVILLMSIGSIYWKLCIYWNYSVFIFHFTCKKCFGNFKQGQIQRGCTGAPPATAAPSHTQLSVNDTVEEAAELGKTLL